jgi:hypothetical protein
MCSRLSVVMSALVAGMTAVRYRAALSGWMAKREARNAVT